MKMTSRALLRSNEVSMNKDILEQLHLMLSKSGRSIVSLHMLNKAIINASKMHVSEIQSANLKFSQDNQLAHERELLLKDGQHPKIAVLCCSDSRVPPEVVLGQAAHLGSLFVVRTAGHVLDQAAFESLQYAVSH